MPKGTGMQITIACHQCNQAKRPQTPSPACQAPPLAELEPQAWRLSLHTQHMARIERTPRASEVVPSRRPRMTPLRAVVTVDLEQEPAREAEVASIVPMEPAIPADEALSFDWGDEPRKLRRTA
jgi:hypothetical protein